MTVREFEYKSKLSAPAATVFAWHEAPGAFERLSPPWLDVEVIERTGGISGGTVTLLIQEGPTSIKWKLAHDPEEFKPGKQFRDYQVEGPFKSWSQLHKVEADTDRTCYLIDHVQYELLDFVPAQFIFAHYGELELTRLFRYRHRIIDQDLAESLHYARGAPMKILVSGSTGLIGSALIPRLTTLGHSVLRLVRAETAQNGKGQYGTGNVQWNPQTSQIDKAALEGFDAVVHLAGESIADGKWTPEKKEKLRASRVMPTRFLAETLAGLKNKPKVFVCASAIGFYGPRGNEPLDENAAKGAGFLADLCQDWESATRPASEAGIRVVNLRTGVVLSTKGGALKQMLLPFQLGAGGQIGNGEQYFSWITLDDECGAIIHALNTESLSGPVNAAAPEAVTNKEFTKALGSVLLRPTLIPIPPFALRILFGEMADELLINGQNVKPDKLLKSGYKFRDTNLESALYHVLGK
jgi:uncharacterized protein